MTLSVAETREDASPMRGLMPLWVGVGIYALFLLAGNRLLIDPDTMWQITVGQWILEHRVVPETDVYSFTMRGQPWISTQWLAQVLYAKTYAIAGWSGPVVLAAAAIAATFALLAGFLSRRLSESTTLVFLAEALALTHDGRCSEGPGHDHFCNRNLDLPLTHQQRRCSDSWLALPRCILRE